MGRRDQKSAKVVAEVVEEPASASEEEEEEQEVEEKPTPEDEGSANSTEEESDEKPAKKAKKSTKGSSNSETKDEDGKKKKKKKRNPEATHPPTTEMVVEALMALDERKGATIRGIKDYILAENTVRPEKLSHLMRTALRKLMEKEAIIRPKGEENKSIMLGRYKIAPKKEEKDPKPRERPASLRKLGSKNAPKKKKKKRKGCY